MPDEARHYNDPTKVLLAKKLITLANEDILWLSRFIGDLTYRKEDISKAVDFAVDLCGAEREVPKTYGVRDPLRFIGRK